MKKLLSILGLGLLMSVGVLFIQPKALQVKAVEEEQITEVVEEPSLSEEVTQTCKDCIIFVKELLSQPLVIAGVSTSVGALAFLIISKAISGISRKKLENIIKEVGELNKKLGESASKKDFNELLEEKETLVQILEKIAPTIKNVKIKKECLSLLEEMKPVKEEVVEFIEEKHEEVKEEVKVVKNDIAEILKK